jgi:hemin uptake protein HemP
MTSIASSQQRADITNPQAAPPTELDPNTPRVVKSELLLRGSRQVFIKHRGEIYRLMQTRNRKLILQK